MVKRKKKEDFKGQRVAIAIDSLQPGKCFYLGNPRGIDWKRKEGLGEDSDNRGNVIKRFKRYSTISLWNKYGRKLWVNFCNFVTYDWGWFDLDPKMFVRKYLIKDPSKDNKLNFNSCFVDRCEIPGDSNTIIEIYDLQVIEKKEGNEIILRDTIKTLRDGKKITGELAELGMLRTRIKDLEEDKRADVSRIHELESFEVKIIMVTEEKDSYKFDYEELMREKIQVIQFIKAVTDKIKAGNIAAAIRAFDLHKTLRIMSFNENEYRKELEKREIAARLHNTSTDKIENKLLRKQLDEEKEKTKKLKRAKL